MKRLLLAVPLVLALLALASLALCVAPAPAAGPAAHSKAAPAVKAATGAAGPAAPGAATAPAAAAAAEAGSADLTRLADDVARDVEAIRGWKFKQPVAKQLVTPEQVRAWLEKEIARQAPPDLIARKQLFLRTVGLLPPDCDLKKTFLSLMEGQVAGYYDSDAKVLCIVKRDSIKRAGLVERIMLAHELTHALDDQHADLAKFLETRVGQSEDGDLAAASILEGSATALMMRYLPRLQLSGALDLSELLAYNQEEEGHNRQFFAAPRYFSSFLATYICGMNFLARGNVLTLMLGDKDVGDEVLATIKDPPRSTEQILHPEKYWDAAARDEPVLVSDEDVTKRLSQDGRVVVHADTVGEMLCAILTTPKEAKPDPALMATTAYWTNPAAAGWGGDRFYLLAAGPSADEARKTLKDPRAVWLTFWDTEKDRDEFLQAYEAIPVAGRAAAKIGSLGAAFFYGFTEAERQALQTKLEKAPPKMTRDAKPWTPFVM
ncbi:MAG: hypothetical protein IMZ44_23870 [Planctomycetes bacterium]|nr:hypothetical protein [Planctomycetota bacterium]